MRRLTKNFFTREAAEKFEKFLRANEIPAKDIEIWSDRDGFGQERYTVKWYVR